MAGQSFELTKFYRAYKAWLDEGANENTTFLRSSGLCRCLYRWALWDDNLTPERYNEVKLEMLSQFIEAAADPKYPFGGRELYMQEGETSRIHLNQHRRAWVTYHA